MKIDLRPRKSRIERQREKKGSLEIERSLCYDLGERERWRGCACAFVKYKVRLPNADGLEVFLFYLFILFYFNRWR